MQTKTIIDSIIESGSKHSELAKDPDVEEELRRSTRGAVAWLRNFDSKSWSLTVRYESGGEIHALYPDFLFVHSSTDGPVVALLDPDHIDLADAPAKAAGLAIYAARHAHLFGRIELIIIEEECIIMHHHA